VRKQFAAYLQMKSRLLNWMVRPFRVVKVRGTLGAASGWMLYTKPDGEDGCTVSEFQGTLRGLLWHRAFRTNATERVAKVGNDQTPEQTR
jgi:hypothetical protein